MRAARGHDAPTAPFRSRRYFKPPYRATIARPQPPPPDTRSSPSTRRPSSPPRQDPSHPATPAPPATTPRSHHPSQIQQPSPPHATTPKSRPPSQIPRTSPSIQTHPQISYLNPRPTTQNPRNAPILHPQRNPTTRETPLKRNEPIKIAPLYLCNPLQMRRLDKICIPKDRETSYSYRQRYAPEHSSNLWS